jgi:hypothetical protein
MALRASSSHKKIFWIAQGYRDGFKMGTLSYSIPNPPTATIEYRESLLQKMQIIETGILSHDQMGRKKEELCTRNFSWIFHAL